MIEMAKALEYWDRHLAKKDPDTVRGYRNQLERFLERTGLSAEELYMMQRRAEAAEDPRDTGEVADLAVQHIKWMEAEGYKGGTIKNFVTALNVFFGVNKCDGFEIPKEDIPFADPDGQHVITKVQLRRAWDRTAEEFKLRNRAMIMLAKDIGLRIGDVAEITVREYLAAEDLTGQRFPVEDNGREIMVRGDGFRRWIRPIVTRKRKRNAYPHIGPEAIEAIDAYIEERRRRSGERYPVTHGGRTEMRLYPVFDLDQKLFLGRGGRPLSKDALGQQFERLCDGFAKISAHSFRKYHRTMLEGAGMPQAWVKKLQGKAASVYSQPEKTGHLTGKYIHCYHALRAFYKDDEEINDLQDKVRELEEKLEAAEATSQDDSLQRQLVELQLKDEEKQRSLDEVMPIVREFQRLVDKEKALDRLIEASKTP